MGSTNNRSRAKGENPFSYRDLATCHGFVVITAMRYRYLYKQSKASIQSMADTHGEMLDHFMNERIGDVRSLANNRDIVDTTASVSLKQDTLSHAVTQYGETYHDMLMVDMDGKLIASSGANVRNDYSDASWFASARDKQDIHYEYRMSRDLGKNVVTFSYPIFDKSNKPIGILTARMSDKIIRDMMEDLIDELVEQGNTGSYPYILDSEGTLLWHPVAEKMGSENIANRDDALGEIAQNMNSGERGSGEYTYEGVESW